jgi:hypothetical protein
VKDIFEDQKDVLRDCVVRLKQLGIEFMLTGSMAMIHYAMMRLTNDIDIVIEASMRDASKIIAKFEPDYYVPHHRVSDAIARKFMFNLLHQQKLVKIDCVVRKDDVFQKQAFARRSMIRFMDDIDLWIISKEDLMLSKLNWAKNTRSEMQRRDVANIMRNGYDENYVEYWAAKLGVIDLLAECVKMLGDNYVEGYDT